MRGSRVIITITVSFGGLGGAFACRTDNRPTIDAASAAQRSPEQRGCGRLRVWELPSGLYVEKTPQDARTADVLTTQARLDNIAIASEYYCSQKERYPASLTELRDFATASGRTTCILAADDTLDAWDRRIRFTAGEGAPDVTSPGPDGRFATVDDVGLPRPPDPKALQVNLAQECGG